MLIDVPEVRWSLKFDNVDSVLEDGINLGSVISAEVCLAVIFWLEDEVPEMRVSLVFDDAGDTL